MATRLIQAPPRDPETKGIVEEANRYLETFFLPGRAFTDREGLNGKLAQWLGKRANRSVVRDMDIRLTAGYQASEFGNLLSCMLHS